MIEKSEILKKAEPGSSETWQMILVNKNDPMQVKIKAIEEGTDLTKPFPLSFSSHPGLGMIKGPKC